MIKIEQATRRVWEAAGAPAQETQRTGRCRVCGSDGRGKAFRVPATFTNWDCLTPGDIVCEACQFCMAERDVVLMRAVGKDKPQCMRNYSHFVVDGAWYPVSKGDKPRMYELLLRHSDVAVIAESGQKHLLIRAMVGLWQFEEQTLQPQPGELARLSVAINELYGVFNKNEIATGRYGQYRIGKFGVARWRELEQAIRAARGGVIFNLAVFLAQKGVKDGTSGDRTAVVDSVVAGSIGGLQAEVRAEHLATVRGQPAGSGGAYEQLAETRQLDMFQVGD